MTPMNTDRQLERFTIHIDQDILDACHPRAFPKQVEEAFQRVGAALRLHFHRAIVAVANIALKAQPAPVRLGKIAKAYPLDIAQNLRLQAAPLRRL